MAIQFGSTAVNASKYCNASGVLQDVTSVVRNGIVLFPSTPRTDNNGVWYQGVNNFTWDSSRNAFYNEEYDAYIKFKVDHWIWYDSAFPEEYAESNPNFQATGNQWSTSLSFRYPGGFTWVASRPRTDNNGVWDDPTYLDFYSWSEEENKFVSDYDPTLFLWYDTSENRWVNGPYDGAGYYYSSGNKYSTSITFASGETNEYTMTWTSS